MIGRGTGNLPFMDFTSFIVRFIFYKIPKDNFKFNNNLIDNETFNSIDKSFKLVVFASYFNEKSSLIDKLLKEAHRLNRKYKLGVFEYYHNFSNNDFKTEWNTKFFSEKFKCVFNQIKNVYLCGTIEFTEWMRDELKNTAEIKENQLIFV